MLRVEELREATAQMSVPELLRYLLLEKFPNECAVTSSLRARSIAVLNMIAEIDRRTPVLFCQASYIYPQSVEYRARILRLLGLTDIRDPAKGETDVLPGDQDHCELIRESVWGGGTIVTTLHLNQSLAGFKCWISAAYHKPYSDEPAPRLIQEGKLVRVDPLTGWTQREVHAYMAEHNLPFHPNIIPPTYHF